MQDLKAAMESSYKQHPAFRFEQSEWSLDSTLVDALDQLVLTHRQCATTLAKASEVIVYNGIMSALAAIFDQLLPQADDEYERLFLVELRQAIERVLHEEREWFTKPTAVKGFRLDNGSSIENAVRMQTDRHFFGMLSQAAVAEIKRISEPAIAGFRANAANGKLKREELSANSGPVVRAIRDILNRDFRAQGVLDAVSAYAGRPMTVTGLALELSVPQATWWRNAILNLPRSPNTLYAHLDESVVYPKSIVYLTDVTEKQGPTSCYPAAYESMHLGVLQELVGRVVGTVGGGANSQLRPYYDKQYHQSVNSEKFRRHFMRLPAALRFNSHLGWDVMPDSAWEMSLMGTEHKMLGAAGTFIAFDGARLLHRGGLMQEGERVALQVIFSDATLFDRLIGKAKRMFK